MYVVNLKGGGSNYNVDEIRVFSPSLHTYNGEHADAEFIIHHINNSGGKNLIVCIPISSNLGLPGNASTQLTTVINSMSKMGNNPDEGGNIQGLNFNLNNFIPNNYFYTYTATRPFYPCIKCIDYIVFEMDYGSINLSSDVLKKIKKLLYKKNTISTKEITKDLEFTYSTRKPIYTSIDPDNNILYRM